MTGRREPLVPTDMGMRSLALIKEHAALFGSVEMRGLLGRRKLLLASTDVHSHAIFVLEALLQQSGADVVNAGPEQSPGAVAAKAAAHDVEAILLSTHNGMALEYAQRLQAELARRGLDVPVLMGGVLNQAVPDLPLPVDVTHELRQLGIHTGALAGGGWQFLLPSRSAAKGET